MKEYLVEYSLGRLVKTNGKKGKKRYGEVVVHANSEVAAKHIFYNKHPSVKGYIITDIGEMKKRKE